MKQEENIRELAIQYFEGRISRADERICSNISNRWKVAMAGSVNGREWMNHRNTDSETDAEWEALKHKMYTQEAIVPLLKKVETWYMEDSPYCCRYSIDCRYYVGYSTGYLLVYAKDFLCLRSSVGG